MVRNRRRKETRPDEIVDAAFERFAVDGYAGARIDDVAERAGVSKGLVYRYFKTKEALFKAVIRRVVSPRIHALAEAMDADEGSAEAFLTGPMVEFCAQVVESPVRHIIRLLIAEGPKHPDLLALYHEEVVSVGLAAIGRRLDRAVAAGEFRRSAVQRFPQLVIAPFLVSMLWRILFHRQEPLPADEMLKAHAEMLVMALKRAEP